jgi:hypothetical protein
MKPAVAEQLLTFVKQRGYLPTRLNVAAAESIVRVYYRAEGHAEDRWGNAVRADGQRYHFQKTTVVRQSKYSGGWATVRSWRTIDLAAVLVREAAKDAGDAATLAAWEEGKQKRVAQKKARSEKSERDRRTAMASQTALKRVAFEHPHEVFTNLRRQKLADEVFDMLRSKASTYTAEYLAALERGEQLPPDEAFTSVEQPPIVPLFLDRTQEWDVVEGGVPYTVRVANHGRGMASVTIGQSGEPGMGVDAFTGWLSHDVREAKGDGGISGRVHVDEESGEVDGALYFIMAREKQRGAGARLISIWCALMAGWGVKAWVGEAVGPEGEAFLTALEKRGTLRIRGRRGSNWIVECA